jgi:hypothetical protein
MLLLAARRSWQWMLGAVPRPVLARLDRWARRQAQRRAERRRQRFAAARR